MSPAFPAFSCFGVELEYMIVDRKNLSILPIADKVLNRLCGKYALDFRRGDLA